MENPLTDAVLGPDGGYRDRIRILSMDGADRYPKPILVSQDELSEQALGAYSVPGTLPDPADERDRFERVLLDRLTAAEKDLDYAWSSRRMWRERALAAEGEVRALRAALSEALESVR